MPEDAVGKCSAAVLRGRVCRPITRFVDEWGGLWGKMTQPFNFSAFERILFVG